MNPQYPGSADPEVRELIENTVPWNLRAALTDLLGLYGIPTRDTWPDHPDLAAFMEHTAVRVLQARRQRAGLSATAALREACSRLRLNPEAVRKQFRRSRRRYIEASPTEWDTTSPKHEKQPLPSRTHSKQVAK